MGVTYLNPLALLVLIALGAVKCGAAPAALANALAEYLPTSGATWSQQGNRRLYGKRWQLGSRC